MQNRYSSEIPVVLIQAVLYIGVIAVTRLARPSLSKMYYNRRMEKNTMFLLSLLRVVAAWSILAAYTIPFFIIPRTVHPLLGWPLYLLGSFSLSSTVINVPPPPDDRPHNMVWIHRRAIGNGLPLVSKWCCQGTGSVCVCVLLRALDLDIFGQDNELLACPD